MRSSSTEPDPTSPVPTTPASAGRPGSTSGPARTRAAVASLLPAGRVARLRLVLIVLLGLAALVTPQVAQRTGAVYTDRSVVSGDVWATPGPPPPPSPSPSAS